MALKAKVPEIPKVSWPQNGVMLNAEAHAKKISSRVACLSTNTAINTAAERIRGKYHKKGDQNRLIIRHQKYPPLHENTPRNYVGGII